jgi:hypothetical protein
LGEQYKSFSSSLINYLVASSWHFVLFERKQLLHCKNHIFRGTGVIYFESSITAWSTVPQLVKKFPVLYVTRRFITAFTTPHPLSVSWARSIHSVSSHLTSWRSILIYALIYAWVFQLISFAGSPHQNSMCTFPVPPTCHMARPSHSSLFDHPNYIWWRAQSIKLSQNGVKCVSSVVKVQGPVMLEEVMRIVTIVLWNI